MHTVGATVVTAVMLYGGMTFSSGTEWLFHPVFEGSLTIVFFIVIGVWLHRLRKQI
jgi:cation transport ATPase